MAQGPQGRFLGALAVGILFYRSLDPGWFPYFRYLAAYVFPIQVL